MLLHKPLKLGSTGIAVVLWQRFLAEKDLMKPEPLCGKHPQIGVFERQTEEATKQYQTNHGLTVDGVLGEETYAQALKEGFNGIEIEQALILGLYQWNESSENTWFSLVAEKKVAFNLPDKLSHDAKAAIGFFRDGSGFAG